MVASVGNAIVQQAGEQGGILDSARVPIGPFRIGFSRRQGLRPSIAVVVSDVAVLMQAFAESDLHFDWTRSLSALTPVFVVRRSRLARNGRRVGGVTFGQLILLDGVEPGAAERSFPHEVVHVLQADLFEVTWDRPVETWIRRRAPGAQVVPPWLTFHVLVPLLIELDDALQNDNGSIRRLKEAEAEWFDRR